MLAYSLNKNMKNLRMDEGNALMRKSRPKSAAHGRGAPVAKRNKREANRNVGQARVQRPPQAQAPHMNLQNGYYYGQAPGAAQNFGHQDTAYAADNAAYLQPGQTYGNQMPQHHAMNGYEPAANLMNQNEQYYQQQQQQQREDLMQEADEAVQRQARGRDGLGYQEGPPKQVDAVEDHDRSPGGADNAR